MPPAGCTPVLGPVLVKVELVGAPVRMAVPDVPVAVPLAAVEAWPLFQAPDCANAGPPLGR
jgi:hypothetical protein